MKHPRGGQFQRLISSMRAKWTGLEDGGGKERIVDGRRSHGANEGCLVIIAEAPKRWVKQATIALRYLEGRDC